MDNFLAVANSAPIWIIALIGVVVIATLCALYTRLAYRNAQLVDLTRAECNHAVRAGIISSIGPSIANVIVVMGMIAVVGAPISWLRLSMIGAASTELTGARIGAEAAGCALGGEGYNLAAMATSWFTMAVNGCGWLLIVFLFTHKMEKLRNVIGKGDATWMGIIGSAACIGVMGDMAIPYLTSFSPQLAAAVIGGGVMALCAFLSKKHHWLMEYSLGIALIAGVAISYFLM